MTRAEGLVPLAGHQQHVRPLRDDAPFPRSIADPAAECEHLVEIAECGCVVVPLKAHVGEPDVQRVRLVDLVMLERER